MSIREEHDNWPSEADAAIQNMEAERVENENEQLVDWVEVYKDESGKWRWRAKSNNGDIIADSGQGYTSRVFTENIAKRMFAEVPVRYESSAL